MQDVLRKMLDLCEVDREIKELRDQLTLYPKMIVEMERREEALKRRKEAAERKLAAARDRRRKTELETRALREQIGKYQQQQMQVKSNKEYQALGSEIAGVEARIDEQETAGLEALEIEEQTQAELDEVEAEMKEFLDKMQSERERIAAQVADKESRLRDGEAEHARLARELPEDQGEAYELLNEKFPGSALAAVQENSCGGCGMELPPQRRVEIRRDSEIVRCDSCRRILYDPASV